MADEITVDTPRDPMLHMEHPRLSILLATVESRRDLFALLHAELLRQSEGRSVELVIACDNKEISIGKKRQNLLEAAKGGYVCFIDDDDWISPAYVDDILAALTKNPDCIGFEIQCTHNGQNPQRAIASMRYKQWVDDRDGYRFCRSTYHKTPVRRELALQAGFPDLRYGEDKIYSERIIGLVKSEVFIKSTLYFYRFSSREKFTEKYGFPKAHRKGVDPTHVRRKFHT